MRAQRSVTTAVLFLIFNRPGTTQKVFEEIRKARPSKLFISADGPRTGVSSDGDLCRAARDVVKQVDWECELYTNFRDTNLGCKIAVSSAINWFFENVEEGIILEDDCVPSQSFFWFCQELLDWYRDDERIMEISGCNFQFGRQRGDGSYYFSRLNDVWGWATWKRAWEHYDIEMKSFPRFGEGNQLRNYFEDEEVIEWLMSYFQEAFEGVSNVWSSQWTYGICAQNGLTIVPNVNLVSNIGFGREDATHGSGNTWGLLGNRKACEVNEIIHPSFRLPDREADAFTFEIIRRTDPRLRKDLCAWLKSNIWKAAKRCVPRKYESRVKQYLAQIARRMHVNLE